MDYLGHILVLSAIFAILAESLDLIAGHGGMLSLAHASFWGVGAYASAILTKMGIDPVTAAASGALMAAALSVLMSAPSLRLQGDYFIIATFGMQMLLSGVFANWHAVTNGPLGVVGIPPLSVFGLEVASRPAFLLAAICTYLVWRVVFDCTIRGPFGRVLRAIRDDDLLVRASGRHLLGKRVQAVAVGAGGAAVAGSLYAHYVSFVDPSSFTVNDSILLVAMVVLGGASSRWGAAVGALVLVALPESMRLVGASGSAVANLRQMAYGTVIVLLMLFRPKGIAGTYEFD